MSTPSPSRASYHHGDLRQALLSAGIELASTGGPDAVVLREATRRVGVSPNAAYRHFADREALLAAVVDAAQARLAEHIDAEFALVSASNPVDIARGHLRAVGSAYVRFALDEPGMFRTAFFVPADLEEAASPTRVGPSGRTPFELLGDSLDELVASGAMPPHRREGAEFLAWSSVHGLAMLLIDGPLRALPRPHADATTQRVIDMVEAGLTA
ncbi:AcrR family transcriptional regulator [Microbacteriaceae bacterium SG_E_30_P1]|uniref:AcrR family transcriptional regulator n=1 Tax=Antiquaquibacter oligotrophicus TaxID=2880260 RepID=A0ABT6KMU1_9MICO|nr:TetR/AcrR family transcriptional regulator [Antiquaquibacter oligotrophicus]MDH6181318.1 AcrR family transcriptional regulator [Antiquaquibacter oligotrophicus]UDF12989.1 TetR/AcrR family transcriptional regulator [Antiquaquibacter oligotrophicus]